MLYIKDFNILQDFEEAKKDKSLFPIVYSADNDDKPKKYEVYVYNFHDFPGEGTYDDALYDIATYS